MSNTHLRAILPQIHQLFARGTNAGLSDGVLLRRYCTTRDETAFATLVARHGAMVLGVCRSILHDESMSEDAFQAVWLVLVRRAGTIRVDDSLGGWLHQVAYRVARRANAESARRRHREQTGADMNCVQVSESFAADPRIALLHEEVARLPESLRQPLVLCLLEGKTQVEAAQEIGCGEATVRRRLTSARERLRTRLRSQEIDTAALGGSLSLPSRLVEAAIKAAGGPLTTLATEVLREMTRLHGVKILASVILVGLVTYGAVYAMAAHTVPAPPAPVKPPMQVAPVAKVDDEVPDPEDRNGWGNFDMPGQVVDPAGKPVAGATIYLRKYGVRVPSRKAKTDEQGRFSFTTFRRLGSKASPEKPKQTVRKQTLPGGISITITVPDGFQGSTYTDAEEVKYLKSSLVATAPGFGFGTLEPGEGVVIKLVPDEPVVGRIIDEAGKPIDGARVRVRNVTWPRRANDPLVLAEDRYGNGPAPVIPPGEGLEPWISTVSRAVNMDEYYVARRYLIGLIETNLLGDYPSAFAPLISAVTTDSEGKFSLKGIGRERVAELYVDGVPDKASTLIVVANRTIPKPIMIDEVPPIFGNRFDLVLEPGRTIEGLVMDRVSQFPLSGLKVIGPMVSRLEYPGFDRFFTTTDALGRYRIEGFPVSKEPRRFRVVAPKELPYFGREINVKVSQGTGPQKLDFPLVKGVWITGKVVDDATGQGLGGQSIEYHVYNDNPYLKKDRKEKILPEFDDNLRTNEDGTFRLRAYPGRGIVSGGGGHNYLEGIGTEKIAGLSRDRFYEAIFDPGGFSPWLRNTTIEVNIPEGVDNTTCKVRLKAGKQRLLKVVGPEGLPQDGLEGSGINNQIQNPMTSLKQPFFNVTNLFPGEEREVVVRCVAKKLIGMAVVKEKDEGEVTLRLEPWANLTGRLVDDSGKPKFAGLRVRLEDGKLPIHTLNGLNYDKQEFLLDADGKFHIDGLVPGAKYRLELIGGGFQIKGDITDDFTLKPGETRDLGNAKVKKLKDKG